MEGPPARGGPIYVLIGDFSVELMRDPTSGVWYFESELRIHDTGADRRRFDPAAAYPDPVAERVASAAAFARAYYDIEVDERIGIEAFDRLTLGARYH